MEHGGRGGGNGTQSVGVPAHLEEDLGVANLPVPGVLEDAGTDPAACLLEVTDFLKL